ncbi:MAG: IPExxxVDY family protein [Bacteroidales bacterium]|nr:IPExxxVDY family protein [Bacteroidales bacterium]
MMNGKDSSKKVHRLKIDLEFPFSVIGISSHENDYRLIWAINENLNVNFVKIENFRALDVTGSENEFSRYFFEDPDRYLSLYVLSNRCDNGYLLPEYRMVDYFLFLKGGTKPGLPEEMATKLKQVEIISTAFPIEHKKIKSLKKLLHLDG